MPLAERYKGNRRWWFVVLTLAACRNPMEVESPPDSQSPNLAVAASAPTYYVSPSGNDRNSGTSPSQAWRTISKVNGKAFSAGSKILFQGGATFYGNLSLNWNDKGTASNPVVVSSYGTGRATINGGSGSAIFAYSTPGLEIRNLIVKSKGRTANSGSGIYIYTQMSGGVKLDYVRIDNVDVSGFGQYGIVIGSWAGTTGFKNVRVTNARVYDNVLSGIATYAQSHGAHQSVYFGNIRAYNNPGKPNSTRHSGSGITMGGVSGGTIERSVAYSNGYLCDTSGGPVGIWAYDSDRLVVQYNESYNNTTNGPRDGGGFDFDQNVKNSIMQYNYSHGNAGPGFLFAHGPNNYNHTGNIIRYNISENDVRKTGAGAITLWGRTLSAEIYNNTVYLKPASSGSPKAVFVHNSAIESQDLKNVHFRNNVLYATGGLKVVSVLNGQLSGGVDLRFEGNNYYAGTSAPAFFWGTKSYSGLATWRSATGQEKVNGVAVGQQADPRLASAGNGGTIGDPSRLSSLGAYRLVSGSPMINKGLNLTQLFSSVSGITDFYSLSTPYGAGYDVGAHEWR